MSNDNAVRSDGSAVELDLFREPEPGRRITPDVLLAAWIRAIGHRPSGREVAKQGAVAKRLVADHTDEEMLVAWSGMRRLFPYSKGEPFDLFDLERKFPKALAKGWDHPDLRWQQSRARFQSGGETPF